MNKLVVVFGLFGLTFFFGLGVTAVQLVTDSFLFPFDSGGFDVDDLLDFNDSTNEDVMFDYESVQEEMQNDFSEATPMDMDAAVDVAGSESVGGATWTCSDGSVIDAAWTNDGECDCNDCSDEDNLFMCANGTAINIAYLNDGDCDCGDTCDDES
jgi:hypothetical protein